MRHCLLRYRTTRSIQNGCYVGLNPWLASESALAAYHYGCVAGYEDVCIGTIAPSRKCYFPRSDCACSPDTLSPSHWNRVSVRPWCPGRNYQLRGSRGPARLPNVGTIYRRGDGSNPPRVCARRRACNETALCWPSGQPNTSSIRLLSDFLGDLWAALSAPVDLHKGISAARSDPGRCDNDMHPLRGGGPVDTESAHLRESVSEAFCRDSRSPRYLSSARIFCSVDRNQEGRIVWPGIWDQLCRRFHRGSVVRAQCVR